MTRYVDTHCHIQSAGLAHGERSTRELWAKAPTLTGDAMVAAATDIGVDRMICVGCDVEDSRLAIEFVQDRPGCFASIGIHPHEAAAADNSDSQMAFSDLLGANGIIAIGECGLDYFYEHSPRDAQLRLLWFQLDLAVNNDLPVIFHVREAFDDFWPVLDDYQGKIRGVLHSFTDSSANLEQALKRGLYIGVNGIATFAKQPEQLRTYQNIPLERLLLETDAPFLTPVPFRGKINEPKQITTVAAFLSELRSEPLESIAEATTRNAQDLFAL